MLLTDFLRALDQVVPLAAAGYERDAIGLQVGLERDAEIRGVMFVYEVTRETVEEAKQRGANLIVAFHPLIFPSVASVTDATRTGALIRELVKTDMALYILHTAFDTHPELGTSRLMAEALGLGDVRMLRAVSDAALADRFGMGAVGSLAKPVAQEELLSRTAAAFGVTMLRHNEHGTPAIKRIAVLGGAGMDYYGDAKRAGADAFITADVRYHDFYRADHDGILLIDAGHAETERFVTKGMLRAGEEALKLFDLPEDFPPSRLFAARTQPNSVRYFQPQ